MSETNKTTIFKVYDEEWSEIMGFTQLQEFAVYRMEENDLFEDMLLEDEMYGEDTELNPVQKQNREIVKQAYINFRDNNIKPTDKETIIKIINFADFEVEEREIY